MQSICCLLCGRKWQKDPSSDVRFFLNLEATDFQILDGGSNGQTAAPGDAANDALQQAAEVDEEDIPF